MYYYQHLNLEKIRNLAETGGRCGHEIRNIAAGFVRIEYPEVQIIDNLSGQIEGIMRDICGYLENRADIKPLIRNAIRPIVCLTKMINEDISETLVKSFPLENVKKMKKYLVYQANCLHVIDEMINKAILEDSKSNFGRFDFEIVEPKVILEEIMKEFICTMDLKKVASDKQIPLKEFVDVNRQVSKYMCNYAHEIQNLCSSFNNKTPENQFTNKIIALAGQIEDSSRKIQDIIKNHNPRIAPNRSDYTANFYSAIIGLADKVSEITKQIEDLTIEEKCPLKITNEEVHRLLSAEENFSSLVKQNMSVGYIFSYA